MRRAPGRMVVWAAGHGRPQVDRDENQSSVQVQSTNTQTPRKNRARHRRARRINKLANSSKSAKPPSPVQSGAASKIVQQIRVFGRLRGQLSPREGCCRARHHGAVPRHLDTASEHTDHLRGCIAGAGLCTSSLPLAHRCSVYLRRHARGTRRPCRSWSFSSTGVWCRE
jgi:hypothetical protein